MARKILITGKDSYIGTSCETYLSQWPDKYDIDTVDMETPGWREQSFAGYDTVFHVAGIAHSDTGKIDSEKELLYRRVNTELAISTAKKAKKDGARQFIFMSSMIVYGDSAGIGKQRVINKNTPTGPSNAYSRSKLDAENGIRALEDENFKVVILRPPMIYGPRCKGNYPKLSRFAQKFSIFPNVKNQRSMLYIYNFAEFLKLMIDNEERGTFFPQNREYTNTSQMVKDIATANGKRLYLLKGFTWILKILSHVTGVINKVFGSFCYDMTMSEYHQEYRKFSLEESIKETEKVNKGD